MTLADENLENVVPGSQGMDVPSACTIVIVAGLEIDDTQNIYFRISTQGKYISKVDRVMTTDVPIQ